MTQQFKDKKQCVKTVRKVLKHNVKSRSKQYFRMNEFNYLMFINSAENMLIKI